MSIFYYAIEYSNFTYVELKKSISNSPPAAGLIFHTEYETSHYLNMDKRNVNIFNEHEENRTVTVIVDE